MDVHTANTRAKRTAVVIAALLLVSLILLYSLRAPEERFLAQQIQESRRIGSNNQQQALGQSGPRRLPQDEHLPFIIVGDFGTGVVQGREFRQLQVATALLEAAEAHKPLFIMTTGDIIYSSGITSPKDPQLQEKFFKPYAAPSLQVPWHIIPGNHDCRGDVDAMLQVHNMSPQWEMPSRYFVKEFSLDGRLVRILYLDTCLLVCGDMSNFRCEDEMSNNLSPEAREAEYAWLEEELAKPAWWKFVVGHWSIVSMMGNGPTPELIDRLLPLLLKHGVHVYFNGHDHGLQHLHWGSATTGLHLVVSGGGGYETHPELKEEADASLNNGVDVRFSQGVHGFVRATLSRQTLRLTFEDMHGEFVYETRIVHPPRTRFEAL
eukprot:m.61923 g.61923  ORF g.61923 m.61923 type:complete len:377 (-) comp13367_c0_seq1:106-1236(-)